MPISAHRRCIANIAFLAAALAHLVIAGVVSVSCDTVVDLLNKSSVVASKW